MFSNSTVDISSFSPYAPAFVRREAALPACPLGCSRALRPRKHRNPLPVQFWLWGLDALHGDLNARGFTPSPWPVGSRRYHLGALTLHSSGLWLDTPDGELYYWRAGEAFSFNGAPLARLDALPLVWPHVLAHERWTAQRRGAAWRAQQLSGKLPARIRRLKPTWEAWSALQASQVTLAHSGHKP